MISLPVFNQKSVYCHLMPRRKKPASYAHRRMRSTPIRRPRWILPFLLSVLGVFILAGITGFTATRFENRDAFCASCHTEPETAYYQREASAPPVDLASFHFGKQTRCIDCHSGIGPIGRATALALGARDLTAFISQHYAQPAPLTRPISDANCLKCHSDVTQRQDFNNHFHVFLSQWQSQDPTAATCASCHQAHVTTGSADIGYLNQDVTQQVCQRCHAFAGRGG
jgi:predicted CXXCH cytochrome family protein